eukprot:scaffold11.g3843.t1
MEACGGELEAAKHAVLLGVLEDACLQLEGQGVQLQRLASCGEAECSGGIADDARWLRGEPGCVLGVPPEVLLQQAPSKQALEAVLAAALPAVEQELARRCRLVAAAAGYEAGCGDYSGLADHVAQLSAAVSAAAAARPGSWVRAAGAATQATRLLSAAGGSAEGVLREHTLGARRAADAARCAALRAKCARVAAKMQDTALALHGATYTRDTLPALRTVAGHLAAALSERGACARQRAARLAQCQALGPEFEALAAAHAALEQQVADAEYELGEVEKYRQLAAVLG